MSYMIQGSSNSCLDGIREDIADMLNLQKKILLHETAIFNATGIYSESHIESFATEHAKLSDKFASLREKYGIS